MKQNLTPKEFYKVWYPTNKNTEIKKRVLDSFGIYGSVFEFGCGDGYNLEYIKNKFPNVTVMGIDVNVKAITSGLKNGRNYVFVGDENTLKHFNYFDVAFTASVLCHIPTIDDIIAEFKRMAKTIILIETQEVKGKYYFSHAYQSYGFVKTDSKKNPTFGGNGAMYDVWVLNQ